MKADRGQKLKREKEDNSSSNNTEPAAMQVFFMSVKKFPKEKHRRYSGALAFRLDTGLLNLRIDIPVFKIIVDMLQEQSSKRTVYNSVVVRM